MKHSTFRVGVLAYEGCFGSEIFGFVDLLTVANQVAHEIGHGLQPFDASVVSPRHRVTASGGCLPRSAADRSTRSPPRTWL